MKNPEIAMGNGYLRREKLEEFKRRFKIGNLDELEFTKKHNRRPKYDQVSESDSRFFIGPRSQTGLKVESIDALKKEMPELDTSTAECYVRAQLGKVGGEVIYSDGYCRVKTRNSTCVELGSSSDDSFTHGTVIEFAKVRGEVSRWAIVECYKVEDPNLMLVQNGMSVQKLDKLTTERKAIPLKRIVTKCLFHDVLNPHTSLVEEIRVVLNLWKRNEISPL